MPAGEFVHLTARAVWIDGKVIVTAVEVADATVHELPHLKCEACVDDGWLVVVVPGPCEIPARARISVRMRAEIAHARWIAELKPNASPELPSIVKKAKPPKHPAEGEML
ncbi:MAG: hypothetical protein WDO13_05230 [Verrucomicrobiota bacterium]